MKGNNPSANQKRWYDLLTNLCGCICCTLEGNYRDDSEQPNVSVHHCDGRTKPLANWYVIPLCAGHHQQGSGPDPSMLAVHGNKAIFTAEYGLEFELLEACVQMAETAGRVIPDGVQQLITQWHETPMYQNRHSDAA